MSEHNIYSVLTTCNKLHVHFVYIREFLTDGLYNFSHAGNYYNNIIILLYILQDTVYYSRPILRYDDLVYYSNVYTMYKNEAKHFN